MRTPQDLVTIRAALGRQLRDARRAAGLTQYELAAAVFTSRSSLACVETGRQNCPRDFWVRADQATQAAGTLLAAYDHLRQMQEHDDRQLAGRNGVDEPSSDLAGLGVDLWELHDALRGRTVGRRGLALIEEGSANLDRIYAHTPAEILAPHVGTQLRKVVEYLGWPQPVDHRRRLCAAAGRLAGLLGWLHLDLSHARTADAWYVLAIDAAREADDASLAGWLHGARSLIPYQRGDHHAALSLIETGRDTCSATIDPTVHAWLAALHARAHAGIGDWSGFRRLFGDAMVAGTASNAERQRHGMDFHDGVLDLNYYEGTSLLLVGRAREAVSSLSSSLHSLPVSRPKARAILMLGLAEAASRQGRLEEAVDHLRRALTTSERQPIMPIMTRAREVAAHLRAHGYVSPTIDDQLDEFGARIARPQSAVGVM